MATASLTTSILCPTEATTYFPTVGKVEDLTATIDRAALETSSKVLDIIGRYRLTKSKDTGSQADGSFLKFIALIYTHVKARNPVPLCLPAFPFKSPNSTHKTLGKLPDKGEEIALAHLNGLCNAIGDVYAPGAKLSIISDGLVYNGMSAVQQLPLRISKLTHFAQIYWVFLIRMYGHTGKLFDP
jgi:hypothetical protein